MLAARAPRRPRIFRAHLRGHVSLYLGGGRGAQPRSTPGLAPWACLGALRRGLCALGVRVRRRWIGKPETRAALACASRRGRNVDGGNAAAMIALLPSVFKGTSSAAKQLPQRPRGQTPVAHLVRRRQTTTETPTARIAAPASNAAGHQSEEGCEWAV